MQAEAESFENRLASRFFAAAVVLPPLFYWATVATVAGPLVVRTVSVAHVVLLVGLACTLPLIALAWTCFSVCAASIERGRLIVHRVAFDRAWPLGEVKLTSPPGPDGALCLRAGCKTYHLRPDRPERFVQLLRETQGSAALLSPPDNKCLA